jgi:hypothetical protein
VVDGFCKVGGKYLLEFKVRVDSTKAGSFVLMNDYGNGSNEWQSEIYINDGYIVVDHQQVDNPETQYYTQFAHDKWVTIKIFIDLELGQYRFVVDNEILFIDEWKLINGNYSLLTFPSSLYL